MVGRAFPGIEDSTSYGTPALKVRGKLLARVHQNVFFITDHYRDYPWILVRFSAVDPGALPDLIERAWRLVAPKALTAKYDRGN
jgi:hypothetical protein